jgi:GNAT superfamily N-acetyltransferase
MEISNKDIDIHCGLHMQQLDILKESASLVSDWLTAYAPDTKPRTANALITNFEESYYASIDGVLAGHIALTLFSDPIRVSSEFGPISLKSRELAHYGIGSLVVKYESRGHGIGSLLLDNACHQVLNNLTDGYIIDSATKQEHVLVSAIAATTSLPMFLSRGFTPDPKLEYSLPYSEIDYDPSSGKKIVSKLFSLHS